MRTITIIAGPTAVGKTKFAIEAAKVLDGEIVSCDSMQLYKYMDIGSAKPTSEEMAQVKHHLVDIIDPSQPFSVAQYQTMAKNAINEIFEKSKIPIISGGTGLYVNSLIYDMDFGGGNVDTQLRSDLLKEAEEKGTSELYNRLVRLDPDAAQRIHPNNTKKLIRALEAVISGQKIKDFKNCTEKCKDYDINFIILTRNRDELYDRINKRVDLLVESGLFEEVKALLNRGLTEQDISMKGIGYKEVIASLRGDCSKDDSIALIKKNTRHFAKRQITWFKRYNEATWLNISDYISDDEALGELIRWLKNKYKFTAKATDRII